MYSSFCHVALIDPGNADVASEEGLQEVKGPNCHSFFKHSQTCTRPPNDSQANCVHDRDSAHKSKDFSKFADSCNINAVLLPARCPDLNPLDYGVFGPAQKKLDKEMELRKMSWDEQCSFLEAAINDSNVDAAIMALPQRIKRCIAAKGRHFE